LGLKPRAFGQRLQAEVGSAAVKLIIDIAVPAPGIPLPAQGFPRIYSSCDIGALQRTVLQRLHVLGGPPEHIFGDMLDRVTDQAKKELGLVEAEMHAAMHMQQTDEELDMDIMLQAKKKKSKTGDDPKTKFGKMLVTKFIGILRKPGVSPPTEQATH